ncbi:hypothetical protein FRB99_002043, partial [Tulasnella sp. 403]
MATPRSTSPVHYDFLPKDSPNRDTPGSTLKTSSPPSQYQKSPAAHPPITSLAQHKKTDSVGGGTDQDGSDSDTSCTNSSDEFNWDDDDDDVSRKAVADKKAKRGRRLWLLFTKLSRPVRTALLAVIFGGIFVTPALVFLLCFPNSVARPHVVPWSLWVAISWGVGCVLSLIVDLFPRFLLWIIFVFYGKAPETFKTQLELFMAIAFWMK